MWNDHDLLCREVETVSEAELAEGLRNLGYRLRAEEMSILAKQVDPKNSSGAISKYAFLASQIDWHRDDLRCGLTFTDLNRRAGGIARLSTLTVVAWADFVIQKTAIPFWTLLILSCSASVSPD